MTKERVNHPDHYNSHPSGVECIDVVEHMGFNLGNAVKYIWRADLKGDGDEDLRKAAWYVDRELKRRLRARHGEEEQPAPKRGMRRTVYGDMGDLLSGYPLWIQVPKGEWEIRFRWKAAAAGGDVAWALSASPDSRILGSVVDRADPVRGFRQLTRIPVRVEEDVLIYLTRQGGSGKDTLNAEVTVQGSLRRCRSFTGDSSLTDKAVEEKDFSDE